MQTKYVIWDKHSSPEVTINLFNIWVNEYEDDHTFRWICELKDTHDLIGTIDVQKKFINYGTCEIGYCYSDKYWKYDMYQCSLDDALKCILAWMS